MELIFLTQPNCSGCKALKRKLKAEEVPFTTVDIKDEVDAVKKHGIQSTPVLILSDEGEEVARIVGYDASKEDDVDEFIDQLD